MKKMKLLAGFLLTLILALGLTVAAYAYDYEVTVSSGSNGTVTNGSETGAQLKATVAYNGLLTIGETTGYWGKPTDARYYFKGFHVSGQEDPVISSGDITIEKDTVLVATYGVVGQMVNYTVNYVDAAGATLYPTETLIGNVGDTPVVAFRYVDGFRPRDLTLSQALDEDPTLNVFTFVYDPAPQEVIVGPAGPAAPAAPGAPGAAVVPGGGNQPAGGGGEEEIEPEPTPLGPGGGGEEIETETAPLGPPDESQPEPGPGPEPGKPGSALPWAIGGGAAVVIAAAIGIIVGVKKKKK